MEYNAVLVDFKTPPNWEFIQGLKDGSAQEWIVIQKVANEHGNVIKDIKRYFIYFLLPLKILIKKKYYKNILAWQQFFGIILATYLRMFSVKNAPKITIMTFIYKEKKGILGRLYFRFISYAVNSGYIDSVIVFSESEASYYSSIFNQTKLFKTEILGIDVVNQIARKGNYYVAAGRSNRDYQWLINAWPDFEKLIIICDTLKTEGRPNIIIKTDCHGMEYHELMAGCKAVIVPLENEEISSGQLVILDAFMHGKPVIATNNKAIKAYVTEKCGFIINKEREDLNDALDSLNDKVRYSLMSQNALTHFKENYSIYEMGKRIGSYYR